LRGSTAGHLGEGYGRSLKAFLPDFVGRDPFKDGRIGRVVAGLASGGDSLRSLAALWFLLTAWCTSKSFLRFHIGSIEIQTLKN
jgi:hypothetical protein